MPVCNRMLTLTFILGLMLVTMVACQQPDLSDEDLKRYSDSIVESLLANEDYMNVLTRTLTLEETELLVEAFMANPDYQKALQTTIREDCVGLILMTTMTSGESLPTGRETDMYCEWYERRVRESGQ